MTKDDVCELKKLLKDLIGEIRALRLAPVQYHYHYEYPQVSSPYVYPVYPFITTPYTPWPSTTCTGALGDKLSTNITQQSLSGGTNLRHTNGTSSQI